MSSEDIARRAVEEHNYRVWRERLIDKVAIALGVAAIIVVGLTWWLYMVGDSVGQ